jgi:hypothetical protein
MDETRRQGKEARSVSKGAGKEELDGRAQAGPRGPKDGRAPERPQLLSAPCSRVWHLTKAGILMGHWGLGACLATAAIVHRFPFGLTHLPRSASILSLISNTGARKILQNSTSSSKYPTTCIRTPGTTCCCRCPSCIRARSPTFKLMRLQFSTTLVQFRHTLAPDPSLPGARHCCRLPLLSTSRNSPPLAPPLPRTPARAPHPLVLCTANNQTILGCVLREAL